ncbi:MAG: patatin-like phospholipase family protein [Burkholderiaceae bacterium]|nr:patatin-like phospholipase family protein [Burkholderiaceae bacterium]
MAQARSSKTPSTTAGRSRIGLALAGGGPLGAIYEVGALCALEESVKGLDLTDCHGYIGVSAGGFLAAGLANGVTPRELCASFIENTGDVVDVFEPALLLKPAWREFGQRLRLLPGLLASAGWELAVDKRSLSGVLERLGRMLPTGVFSNEALEKQLRRQFALPGRTNDFRELKHRLVLVATQLDSGQATPFGQPGWDHVPISQAVQASAALPGLFPPVEIEGRHYVDGALKKTIHATVLLDEGLDLLICLNPLVPFDATHAGKPEADARIEKIPRLVDGGLPLVLSQTFRSLIHSRLELGLRGYERSHPDTDILLFEPDHRDPEMFLANTFSYSQRRHLAEHAYQQTRALLRSDAAVRAKLERHGLLLNDSLLNDKKRVLVGKLPPRSRSGRAVQKLDATLTELERLLPRLPRKA